MTAVTELRARRDALSAQRASGVARVSYDGKTVEYRSVAEIDRAIEALGLPLYARMIPDRDRDEWVRLEIESNPLPICTRPQVLRSARRT